MADEQLKKEVHDKYGLSEEDTRIAHLDEKLHSREKEGFIPWRERRDLPDPKDAVQHDWQHSEALDHILEQKKKSLLPSIAFGISLVMLAGAAVFAYSIFSGTPAVEGQPVVLEINGPHAIRSGEVLELQVVAKNETEFPLELAELVVTYPHGMRNPENPTEVQTEERIPLGQIAARSTRRGTIRTIAFGASNEVKQIKATLQYRLQGGSIIYQAGSLLDAQVTSDALSVEIDAQQESTSGQSTDIEIKITSHAISIIHGAVAQVRYPFGFTPTETEPEAKTADSTWDLGDMLPGESRKIHIRGKFAGAKDDERVVTVEAGLRDSVKTSVDVPLVKQVHTIILSQPFIALDFTLNGEDPNTFSFTPEEEVKAQVRWKNTRNAPIQNATISVTIGGDALNKKGVKVVRGFYRSLDSIVLWDKQSKPESFSTIPPFGGGIEEFTIKTLPEAEVEKLSDPVLTFSVHASGRRIAENGVPETLQAVATHTTPVQTKASFVAEAKYFTSPFPKSGPLPPRVDYETIYAIEWKLNNSSSDLVDAEVTAQLPPNVRFLSVRTPVTEQITFNQSTRTVTWFPGKIQKGTGIGDRESKNVTFAIGLVPSASQIGAEPDIVLNQKFTATDSFSKKQVEQEVENLNTILTEEGFNEKYAPVVEGDGGTQ